MCICFPNTVQYIKTLMRLNKILAEATVIIEIIYFFWLVQEPHNKTKQCFRERKVYGGVLRIANV